MLASVWHFAVKEHNEKRFAEKPDDKDRTAELTEHKNEVAQVKATVAFANEDIKNIR